MNAYTIDPAEDGGFVVMDPNMQPGYRSSVKFAGNLDDCLDYIRQKLSVTPAGNQIPIGDSEGVGRMLRDVAKRHDPATVGGVVYTKESPPELRPDWKQPGFPPAAALVEDGPMAFDP